MTVSATLAGVFLKGTAAARPAANAVAGGTVYSATDTGVISQSDGASWSVWATISSGLADPMTTRGDFIVRGAASTTRLPLGAANTVMQSDGTDPAWVSMANLGLAIATYTPTLTASSSNPTLGSGSSAIGRYFRLGKLVIAQIQIIFGSSGVAAGSGTYQVSLPVAADASNPNVFGTGNLFDNSAGSFSPCVAYTNFDGTNIRFTQSGSTLVTNASPWTWAASDQIQALIAYEAD